MHDLDGTAPKLEGGAELSLDGVVRMVIGGDVGAACGCVGDGKSYAMRQCSGDQFLPRSFFAATTCLTLDSSSQSFH